MNIHQALKAEIQQLKSNPALPAATTSEPVSIISASEAEAKLASYQQFMSEYIVNSQNQKLLAVREAELKAEKKFQERLEKLLSASGVAIPPSDAVKTEPAAAAKTEPAAAAELSLFQKRNLKVAAAGEAGKSRWGSLEVQKAAEHAKNQPVVVASSTVEETSVFDQRNARVLAAAAAGKSRWGDMEVQRAKINGIASPVEDRVNIGASLFDQRNARVLAAAAAGKSRWGEMEVQRAKSSGISPSSSAAVAATPVTLQDRVNLGARLLGV
jgi:hypothetical protein